LSQAAQRIIDKPSFNDLAARDAKEIGSKPVHLLTCRGNAIEFTFLRALDCVPDNYLVPFGDDLINDHVKIRERSQVPSHTAFQTLAPDLLSVHNKTLDEQVVGYFHVSFVEAFLYPTSNESLVLFQTRSPILLRLCAAYRLRSTYRNKDGKPEPVKCDFSSHCFSPLSPREMKLPPKVESDLTRRLRILSNEPVQRTRLPRFDPAKCYAAASSRLCSSHAATAANARYETNAVTAAATGEVGGGPKKIKH
jgi:hypothetical protein